MSIREAATIQPCDNLGGEPPSAPLNILLVDDEETACEALRAQLSTAGFKVASVSSGEEAVDLLRGGQYDVIIADLVMPGWVGAPTICVAKEIDPQIEVIILTRHGSFHTAIDALRQGACDFLTKPAALAEVRSALLRVLERRRNRADAIRVVIESAREAIVVFDRESTVHDFNPAAEQIFGLSRQQAVGRKLTDFAIPPRSLGVFREHLANACREGRDPLRGCREVIACRLNGGEFPFEISTAVIETPHGRLLSTFGHDNTGRKEAEKATRDSEAKLKVIFDGVEAGIFLIDPVTHQIVEVNLPALKIVGAAREAVVGAVCHKFICPADCGRCPVTDLGQDVDNSERILLALTGERIPIIKTVKPVAVAGRPLLLESFVDISARRRAEQALSEAEAHFRSLFASIPLPTYFFDAETLQYLEVNEAAVAATGYSREELLQMRVTDLAPPEFVPGVIERIRMLHNRGPVRHEGVYRFKSGQLVHTESNIRTMDFRRRRAVLSVDQDVTVRKQAEAAMAEHHAVVTLVADVGAVLTRGEALRPSLQQCAEILIRKIGAALVRVWTLNEGGDVLELQASAGLYTHIDGGHARVPVGKFKIGRIAESGEPHLTNSVQTDPWVGDPEWARRKGMVAFAGYPLQVERRVMGVVAAFARQPLTEAVLQAFAAVAGHLAQFINRQRAEDALRDNEEKYRALYESSRDAIMTMAPPAWRFTAGNPAALALFGAKDEAEFVAETPWGLSPEYQPDGEPSSSKASRLIALAMEKGSQYFEWTHKRFNGEEFPATVMLTKMIFRGKPLLQGTVRDLTERKRAEKQTRLQTVALESAANGIVITDRAGVILWVNPAFTRLTGYTAAEAVGQKPHVLKSGAHEPAFYQKLWETVTSGEVWEGEIVNRRKDGTLYTEQMTITPVRDSTGVISHFIAIKQDITERKRAEKELLFKTALLEAETETTIDGVLVVDQAGHVLLANKQFSKIWNFPEDLLKAGEDKTLLAYATNQLKNPVEFLERVNYLYAHPEERTREEVELRDGRVFDRYSAPLQDALGGCFGRIWYFRDITQRKQAEKALQERTAYLDSLFEVSPMGIVVLDTRGRIQMSNTAFERLFMYSRQEIQGAMLDEFVVPPELAEEAKSLTALCLTGSGAQFTSRRRRRDGTLVDVDIYGVPLIIQDELRGVLSLYRDVTERHRAEAELLKYAEDLEVSKAAQEEHAGKLARLVEELAHERDLLGTLMDTIPDFVFYKDRESRFLRTNPAHAKVMGLDDPRLAVGKTDFDFFPAKDAEGYLHDEQQVISTGQPLIGRIEGVRQPDGQYRWCTTSKVPIRDPRGEVAGLVGITRDITERMQAEEILRTSEERYRELFENASDMVYTTNLDTRLTSLNRVGRQILGYSAEEIADLDLRQLVAPKHEEIFQEGRRRLMAGESDVTVESEFVAKDGRAVLLEVKPRLIYKGGKPVGVQVTARDITGRDEAEMELRHAQKLESVGRLASGIAHEINTPIQFVGDNTRFLQDSFAGLKNLLISYQELRAAAASHSVTPELLVKVRESEEEADCEYLLEEIPKALTQTLDGVTRVATIVRAMKEFAHPEGKEMAAADLNRALLSTLTVARNELKYVADVVTDFGDLPLVVCNIGDLNQVFLNLLVNAAHAIGEVVEGSGNKGTIRVSTTVEGNSVLISIADTGGGIPEAIRGRIFDPFFTTKEVGRGTGQGLTIARTVVVDRHKGALTFESEVGKGTTFYIRLPLDPGACPKEAKVP